MVFFALVLVAFLFALIAWYVFGRMSKGGEELTQEFLDEEQIQQLRVTSTKAERNDSDAKHEHNGNLSYTLVAPSERS